MKARVTIIIFLLAALMLALTPFFKSGKLPLVQLVLNLGGALLLLSLVWSNICRGRVYRTHWLFILFSTLAAALYLVPVPGEIWMKLPGRELYADVYSWLDGQYPVTPDFRLSIVPYLTWGSLLALIPLVAFFLATVSLPRARLMQLVHLFLVVAVIQAILGILQFLAVLPGEPFGIKTPNGMGMGTYPNPDHYAALLEMALPIGFAMLVSALGHGRNREGHDDIDLLRARVSRALLHGGILFLLLVAVFFSRSRAGALLGILAVVLSVLLFARQAGKAFSMKSTSLVSLSAVLVAASIAILPVLNRFMTLNPMEDDRWIIFRSTLSGIASFFPVGTGPGTFPEIYRAFQPVEKLFFVNHVHNDYLEILFEMGLFGAIIIAGFLLLYVQGWRRLRRQHWDELHYFQVASGIGIFILLLHSLVDFNLHTPANAIVFVFLCGIFFRKRHDLHRHRKSGSG